MGRRNRVNARKQKRVKKEEKGYKEKKRTFCQANECDFYIGLSKIINKSDGKGKDDYTFSYYCAYRIKKSCKIHKKEAEECIKVIVRKYGRKFGAGKAQVWEKNCIDGHDKYQPPNHVTDKYLDPTDSDTSSNGSVSNDYDIQAPPTLKAPPSRNRNRSHHGRKKNEKEKVRNEGKDDEESDEDADDIETDDEKEESDYSRSSEQSVDLGDDNDVLNVNLKENDSNQEGVNCFNSNMNRVNTNMKKDLTPKKENGLKEKGGRRTPKKVLYKMGSKPVFFDDDVDTNLIDDDLIFTKEKEVNVFEKKKKKKKGRKSILRERNHIPSSSSATPISSMKKENHGLSMDRIQKPPRTFPSLNELSSSSSSSNDESSINPLGVTIPKNNNNSNNNNNNNNSFEHHSGLDPNCYVRSSTIPGTVRSSEKEKICFHFRRAMEAAIDSLKKKRINQQDFDAFSRVYDAHVEDCEIEEKAFKFLKDECHLLGDKFKGFPLSAEIVLEVKRLGGKFRRPLINLLNENQKPFPSSIKWFHYIDWNQKDDEIFELPKGQSFFFAGVQVFHDVPKEELSRQIGGKEFCFIAEGDYFLLVEYDNESIDPYVWLMDDYYKLEGRIRLSQFLKRLEICKNKRGIKKGRLTEKEEEEKKKRMENVRRLEETNSQILENFGIGPTGPTDFEEQLAEQNRNKREK